ncbi:MAG: phospholipase C [Terriglobales bacterium]
MTIRFKLLLLWSLLICAAGVLMNLEGCGADPSIPPPPPKSKIHHIVIIFQENRTPDNLFQGLPNADIAASGLNSQGQTIPLVAMPLAVNYDMTHTHPSFVKMYDNGKMDGADLIPVTCKSDDPPCPPANPQFGYANPSEVAPYMQLAKQYTFADRMFQTNQGPSFPAHQFIISGTSAPSSTSHLFASENTIEPGQLGPPAGCDAPQDVYVPLIDPSGDESRTMYPCFEHATLMDRLDAENISWRYYAPSAGSIWTAPNAIQHLRSGPDWNNVILDPPQVLKDVRDGNLTAVSWVIPAAAYSDHAGSNEGSGPAWVASIVNAIGSSPYWADTAILISWDDWGGWYDHVAPTIFNSYEYGFRVPLIVVSPYAKPGYVSHLQHDFGSILKFIETNWGLTSVGFADTRADDLSDCFDFTQAPLSFQLIAAPLNADHFLNDKRPMGDPDDD